MALRLSEAEVPANGPIRCEFDVRRGTLFYEREAKQSRKLRAIGGPNWIALADSSSRMYRFEWTGQAHRIDHSLLAPPEATIQLCQMVPSGETRAVFSVSRSLAKHGLLRLYWTVGELRWVTEGLGVWYGIDGVGEVGGMVFGVAAPS